MRKEVVLVAGLPGSGKTTYLSQLQEDWLVFDDFKAGAYDNSPLFHKSRMFQALVAGIREGSKCVVADIDFCNRARRAEAESAILATISDVEIHWLFFACDVTACRANIEGRNRASLAVDLYKLDEYSRIYSIPMGAIVLPVRSAAIGHAKKESVDPGSGSI